MTDGSFVSSVSLLPWWEEWDRRLGEELAQFAVRCLPVTVVEDPRAGANRLRLETTVQLPEGPTRIVVVYPDGYPHRRFQVFAPDLSLSRHRAPGGNLCVFPRDARWWHPTEYLAADIVADDVPNLVALVRTGGDSLRQEEDPQGEPVTAYYGGTVHGGIIVDKRILGLALSDGDKGTFSISFANDDSRFLRPPPDPKPDDWALITGQGLLVHLRDSDGTDLIAPPSERLAGRFGPAYEGRWTYLAEPPIEKAKPDQLWDAVMNSDPDLARWAHTSRGGQLVGVCIREEVAQDVHEPAWFFLTRNLNETGPTKAQKRSKNPATKNTHGLVPSDPQVIRALRWTPTDLGARIPELKPLREKTVTVMGLGSLGAPVAQELAKSRIGTLRLTDFDHLDPGTSVRHPLGLPYAGLDKGLALGRWLTDHNPEVQVEMFTVNVGAAFPEGTASATERELLQGLLTGTDLFIGATAEPDVNRQLDAMALRLGIPRLYLWSQSGYGGIVALLQAGKTGCFHCLSLFLSKRSQEGNDVVQVPPDVGGQAPGTIQGRGCAAKTFTASHADLLPISLQAARVAYGFLCGNDPDGYPPFEDDVFAVQVRETTGQPIPPRWTSFKLPSDDKCSICHPS